MLLRALEHRFLKTGPVQLIFFVTNKCNARCKTCFYWKNLGATKNELTLKEIKKISESMNDIIWFLVSGGEPFLRKDLDKICETFYVNNKVKHITIPTNGLLPKTIFKKTKLILEKCPKASVNLSLSLDGIEKKHDYVRGVKGNFKKVIETFKLVKKLRKSHKNLSIKFHTVITNENYKNLGETIDYVKKLDPDIHTLDFVRGDPRDKWLKLPPKKELKSIVEKIKKLYSKNYSHTGLSIHSSLMPRFSKALITHYNNLFLKIVDQKKQVIPCLAGDLNVVIDPHGNVRLCEMLNSFGNLRDFDLDFKKLWKSEKLNTMRKSIKAGKCFCYHPCYQYVNILFNPIQILSCMRYFRIK